MFETLQVETFGEHCSCDLYTLKHNLIDHTLEELRTLETLSAFDGSSYGRFIVQVRQALRRTLQTKQKQLIQEVSFTERDDRRAQLYRA